MLPPAHPNVPDKEQVELFLPDSNITLRRWERYSFATDFLTPSDGWEFVIGDENLPESDREALKIGAVIRLNINAITIGTGRIDSVEFKADRRGGQEWTIRGRDKLAQAVDQTADPTLEFKEGSTVADVIRETFKTAGWSGDDFVEIDNEAFRDARTGGDRGIPTTTGKKAGRPLKSFVLHQLKPHNHEGLFAFASRVSQRFGLWIWCSADGSKLIVSKPQYIQDEKYRIDRNRGDGPATNVISGTVKWDFADQPSIIIADGFSGGGEFGKGRIKSYCVNPAFGIDTDGRVMPEILTLLAKFPEAKKVELGGAWVPPQRAVKLPFRPMFLHDDESKTQGQLDNYVRREMSLLFRKSLTATYTVEGHGQIDKEGNFVAWNIDTLVDVHDEAAGLNDVLYVLGCTYDKSRSGGTTTTVNLIRRYSIIFDEETSTESAAAKPAPEVDETSPEAEKYYEERKLYQRPV